MHNNDPQAPHGDCRANLPFLTFTFGALLALPVMSQEAVPAGAQDSGQQPAEASAPALQEIPTPAKFAIVKGEGLALRCFASEMSPRFDDVLPDGMPLAMLQLDNGYVQVRGPFGPKGWVSKRFTKPGEQGTVVVEGIGVSFRYRPKAGEAPVELLSKDAVLTVVGETDEWWQVRHPGGTGWLLAEEVDVMASANPTIVGRWREAARIRAEAVAGFAAEKAAMAKAQAEQEARMGRLQLIRDAYAAELQKPHDQRSFAAVLSGLEKLAAETPEEDKDVQGAVASLKAQVENQKWVAEAMSVKEDKPPTPAVVTSRDPVANSRDDLARFDAIGWLRYRPSASGDEVFALEKGGKVLFFLKSPGARYDLRIFDGVEVGVVASGAAERPALESMRVMPVGKLEVLGVPRR